ncbi:MAG: hypothetical protein QOI11_4010, partial [Candidatus Eremiobacteraeota bacterium]|nr:hypothetical protein [Candidatus Eremiobacteraeota bacterium]
MLAGARDTAQRISLTAVVDQIEGLLAASVDTAATSATPISARRRRQAAARSS